MAREKDNIALSDEHNSRGIELADRGWLDEAIREFKRAIDLDPDSAHAHDNLATVYAEKKLYREALAEYLTALRLEPDSATAHYNLACFLSTHGPEFAVSAYRQAIELDPNTRTPTSTSGSPMRTTAGWRRRLPSSSGPLTWTRPMPSRGTSWPRCSWTRATTATLLLTSKRWCASSRTTSKHTSTSAFATRRRASTPRRSWAYGRARELNAEDLLLHYNLAALYALWGKKPEALVALKTSLELDRAKVTGWLATDPMFDALKGDPEYESLL